MKKTTKDIYVYVHISTDNELNFTVSYHDNTQKPYKFDGYALRELRCSNRDFIESVIRDHYELIGESLGSFKIHFS